MLDILILWLTAAFLSFGVLGLNYIYTRSIAKKPWEIEEDRNYTPRLSIIVPTYNEREVIDYKLKNLAKLEYPRKLMQIIFVDSQSTDSTVEVIRGFAGNHPNINIKILTESERTGKSSALNVALEHCENDVVVVSDADCFWPPDILSKALPYLADPTIGAISGPKKLLNAKGSSVAKSENAYLKSMNLMKLGDSKKSSTILFEGGFGAYKKVALDSFDPYDTGSDDCGTVIGVLEKGFRAIMIPEAEFFTTFPRTWKGKIDVKMRRANQLIQILQKYAILLFKNKIKTAREIAARNLIVFLLAPLALLFFLISTVYLMLRFPLSILFLSVFLIPKVRTHLVEAVASYLILLCSIVSALLKKKFTVWERPKDRTLLSEEMLLQKGLI